MFDGVFPILASSIQVDVYTILCVSDMSIPGADILPGLIVFKSFRERSTDPIPRTF